MCQLRIKNVLVMYEFKLGDLSGSMELNQSLAVNQQGF